MGRFEYVLETIRNAPFRDDPFRHLYIENLFEPGDFEDIISTPQIRLPPMADDRALLAELQQRGFQILPDFAGTTKDVETYLRWHGQRHATSINHETTDGFGVVLRLTNHDDLLGELEALFTCDDYWTLLAERFEIDLRQVRRDFGLQKYLDGYEISPHPDIRLKALTFMLNLNPSPVSEALNFHTHYLTLKQEWRFIQRYWHENPDAERCWLPWSWCDTAFRQTKNNSLLIFVPANDTFHAVKASYDHLMTQRTQYYGNLWFHMPPATKHKPEWRFFAEMQNSASEGRPWLSASS